MKPKHLLATGAIAIAAVAGTAAGAALAGGGGSSPPAAAPFRSTPSAGANLDNAFHDALQALVADGTISQAQADTIREQGDSGSIDPRQLVRDGVVTANQMTAVAARLDAVKRQLTARTSR